MMKTYSALAATLALTSSVTLNGCKDDKNDPVDPNDDQNCITNDEIQTMLEAWKGALQQIGQAFTTGDATKAFDPNKDTNKQDCKAAAKHAEAVIKAAYAYDDGVEVLFKPTYASGKGTFRPTADGALSYFVGDKCFKEYKGVSSGYPEDGGFALGNTAGEAGDLETYMGFELGSWAMKHTLVAKEGDEISQAFCDAALAQAQFTVPPVRAQLDDSINDSQVDKSWGFIKNPNAGKEGALPLKINLHHSSPSNAAVTFPKPIGGDPSTWSPSAKPIGGDPSTWSPDDTAKHSGHLEAKYPVVGMIESCGEGCY